MRYYKYWATVTVPVSRAGKEFTVSVKGFSNLSQIDAFRNAESQKEEISQKISQGRYETSRDILVEEVIKELEKSKNPLVITRNRYGSLVLNASDIIFTDHDMHSAQIPYFFGLLKRQPKEKGELLEAVRSRLMNAGIFGRIYETKNGYRCIITNRREPGGTPESIKLLKKLVCDRQYILMTKIQKCYRTRLTPKPFRVKLPKPPVRFPFATDKARALFDEWLDNYQEKSQNYATCKFIEEIGSYLDARILGVVKVHDEMTKALSSLALA